MTPSKRFDRRLLEPVAAVLVIGGCVLLVDRPLALWSHATLFHTAAYDLSALVLGRLDQLLALGAILLVPAVLWRILRGPAPWLTRFLVGAGAAALGLVVSLTLKFAIGRSQAYPLFLQDHIYTLHLLSRSGNYAAFPSATMTTSSAFLRGLGPARGPGRIAAGLVLAVLATALLVTSSHWLSDVLGGTWLGLVLGAAVHRRSRRAGSGWGAAAGPT